VLFTIAYRILGGTAEADRAVRETWAQYAAAPAVPAAAETFLLCAVTRVSLGMLRPARAGRPRNGGPPADGPGEELARSLSTAALLLLERLSPLERAVFVLREVFGCGPAQIASAVGCSQAAARRLVAEVSRTGDGGGQAPPWPERICGAEHVARMIAAIVPPLIRIGVRMEPRQVDGRPGTVFRDRDGRALRALSLDISDGLIQTIRWTAV
jgi:RNA polymerase sigma-70 factor (ECF subfamily)